MERNYTHLGSYSDWVSEAHRQANLYPMAEPGVSTRQKLLDLLGFNRVEEQPLEIRRDFQWEKDGLVGEAISWWVGYGPRTQAWLLRPAGHAEPLPGILALHDHGGFKFYGKEKIADGPLTPDAALTGHRDSAYGGRAFANEFAKQGFAVLVHDVFLWGSRRFPLEDIPLQDRMHGLRLAEAWKQEGREIDEIAVYNAATGFHEHTIEKYCNLLGTTLAGVVSHEDRIAFNYLMSREDVIADRLGCVGLSGGGNRSALLLATSERIKAAVIVGLMSTYPGLLDHNVISHTWMFFPNGWARHGDWPDIAASRAPMPLLVQYDREDDLFTLEGMQAAHERIISHYHRSDSPQAYTGQFYPGPHKFDLEMQSEANNWFTRNL